jgi:poly(3-hydroxybutyrate) depolymerase
LQIAAVWRMAEKLATQGKPGSFSSPVAAAGVVPQLLALDQSAAQVMLRWQPVAGATGYRVYRSSGTQAAKVIGAATTQSFWADAGLSPDTAYRYTVRAVVNGKEGHDSNAVSVSTSRVPPACDPYFSLAKNTPVDKYGEPTKAVCD